VVGVVVAACKYAAKNPNLEILKGPVEDTRRNLVLNSPLYLLEYPPLYFFLNM